MKIFLDDLGVQVTTHELYALIGLLVISFGRLEFAMDCAVLVVNREKNAKHTPSEGPPPIKWDQKARYLEANQSVECNSHASLTVENFCSRIEFLNELRNHLYHGGLLKWSDSSSDLSHRLWMSKLKVTRGKGKTIGLRHYVIDESTLCFAIEEATEIEKALLFAFPNISAVAEEANECLSSPPKTSI